MDILKKIFFVGLCLLAAGCYYDSQEALYNNVAPKTCDTTNITYSLTIAPIINLNCNTCHSSSIGLANGAVLDNYQDLKTQALNGNLMGDINQLPGHNAMPLNGNKLDQCSIAYIQHWVDMNTPNN